MRLEDKISGRSVKFNVYNDFDLPFLNPKCKGSELLKGNIIDADADDDC